MSDEALQVAQIFLLGDMMTTTFKKLYPDKKYMEMKDEIDKVSETAWHWYCKIMNENPIVINLNKKESN